MAAFRYIVDDVDAAVAFYCDLLGFKVKERWGPAFAIVEHGDVDLWLSGPGTSARRVLEDGSTPIAGGWNRFVLEVSDIEQVCERLQVLGALRNPPIEGPGGTQALVRDPSGNLVELFQAS